MYVCATSDGRNAAIAFACDRKTGTISQINFTLITKQQGISGRMIVKNGSAEVQIPMIGLRTGLNGFASAAVPEAFESIKKLLDSAGGPLTFMPIDTPDVLAASIEGASIANAFKTATVACKGA
jgi:hypothetical protein